jgi:hypothetical protein
MSKNVLLGLVAVAGLSAAANAQVTLTRLSTINLIDATGNPLSAKYVGNNTTSLDWNGTDIVVAGFNNAGGLNTVGMSRISNVYNGNFDATAATFSDAFGLQAATPAQRGYLDVARKGNIAYGAFEAGGGAANNGIHAVDVTTGLSAGDFNSAGYRASGIAIDGKYGNVVSSSVATGMRQFAANDINNISTQLYGPVGGSSGYSILPSTDGNTNWRDVQVDSATGDVYYRKQNGVWKSTRSAENAGTEASLVGLGLTVGDGTGQQIEIARGGALDGYMIFNSRNVTSITASLNWTDGFRVRNLVDLSTPTLSYVNFDPTAVGVRDGARWFDFSYDAGTNTLAVLDVFNKKIYIFGVPAPSALSVLGMGALVAGRRRRA